MSFSEELDRLLRLVDGDVPVAAAAVAVGISRGRAYALLRAAGRGRGVRTTVTDGHRLLVVAEYGRTGSVNAAAKASGLSHDAARRVLVRASLVPAERTVVGKPDAKARFLALVAQGWSARRAAREVGVHRRTAQDWARGIRKHGNKRFHPDGLVVDYDTGTRYIQRMKLSTPAVVSERYLSLDDRLAIADGLVNKHNLSRIAADMGRHRSTISREVRAHSIDGVYLPHQAHRDAAEARARVKAPKLVVNQRLRDASCLLSRSRTGSCWTIQMTRVCA